VRPVEVEADQEATEPSHGNSDKVEKEYEG
jgi:hypothetical protein